VTRWGTVKIDHRTHDDQPAGVFAAGDIVRGASLVVWAIRDGRDAADAIHTIFKSAKLRNKPALNGEPEGS
jgi:glutamate synthase (NADPH/NADH) small chain